MAEWGSSLQPPDATDPVSKKASIPWRTERFCRSLFAGASPEFTLLTACCRWPPEEARGRASALSGGSIRWPSLLRLAERHRVTGLVAATLRGEPWVPADVAAEFAARAGRLQRDNLTHVALALRVARALEASGIQFAVLKGAPLSQLAFGTTAVRHMRDLDVLVEAGDLEGAERLLHSQGFEREARQTRLTSRQAKLWQRFRKHHGFVHRQTGLKLELHWRAFDNAKLGDIRTEDVQWVEVGAGQRLPTLPTDELLLLLCAHGASHAWFRLKWIADIAALLRTMPDESMAELLRTAGARDLDRPVEQARLLCAALFGSGERMAVERSTPVGRWLAGVGRDALLTEVTRGRSPEADFVPPRLTASRFLLRRSWRYRLEEARVNAASPADWNTLRMPDRLQFLYPLLRVPLWVRRRWFSQRAT